MVSRVASPEPEMRRLAGGVLLALLLMGAHVYNGSEVLVRDLLRDHRGWVSTTPVLSHEARDRAQEIHAEWQQTGGISHAGAFSEVEGCWWLGEVIGFATGPDYETSAAWVVNAWHASPTHEAVIHDPNYTRFGVGVVRDGDTRFYVAVFGRPCSA